MLLFKSICNLGAGLTLQCHTVHALYNRSVFIGNELVLILRRFHIAVWSASARVFAFQSLCSVRRTNFFGNILCIPFVYDVLERSKFVLTVITVNTLAEKPLI